MKLLSAFALIASVSADSITWETMTKLPSARSDMTATTIGDKIYIVGGCAADQINFGGGWYGCPTITEKCDIYDPNEDSYASCADAPNQRYRHAAVEVDGKVWLIGGVDVTDAVVTDIDVYDPVADSWTTFGSWDDATTDLAAFADGSDIYVIGGYVPTNDYQAESSIKKFSTTATSLSLTEVGNLKHPRGDIFAAVANNHVYITGGFNHHNWCAPVDSIERWDIGSEEFTRVANATYPRGDKALVHINSILVAVGGETKDENCGTTAVEHVEIYDTHTGEWTTSTEIPEETFRFVAVAHEPTDSIFIFGGQNYYDEGCDCYPISDSVLKFKDEEWVIDNIDGAAPSVGFAFGAAAATAAAFALLL